MKLKTVIAQYVAFRKSLGAHFKRAEGYLNAFCRYLGEEINMADVQAEQVQTFLTGTGPITRAWQSKHGTLNGLYRYTIRTIPFKKAMKREITYLEKAEMDALLAAPDRRTPQGQRDYALLLFLYNTGARADEAAQLKIGNLELAQAQTRTLSSVRIHGKGNKLRRCPLWPHTASALTALLNDRAQHEHVFLNRCGRPITRFGIHTMVERYVKRVSAKLPALTTKRVSPHSLRHTTATHLLRAGVNINTIRAWLGHVSIDTTNICAETDLEMKAKALATCEIKEIKRTRRWRDDKGLMAFLRTL